MLDSQNKSGIHICFVIHEYPPVQTTHEFLEAVFSLTDWVEALEQKGSAVSVYIRFHINTSFVHHGVQYHFVKDHLPQQLHPWQIPRKFHQQIANSKAHIVHAHNMNKVFQHWHLAKTLQAKKIPILIQNHAEIPNHFLRNQIQKWLFPPINAFLFCAQGQESPWLDKGIIAKDKPIFFTMEASTHFKAMPREKARKKTGLKGNPIFLWVGNLDNNKDPKTILYAFEQTLKTHPDAQLYMVYKQDQLDGKVQRLIAASSLLSSTVHLLGAKKRADLEMYYNSADYFILGSHKEGSGYAAMEAMACACIPILSDIPSYRMMTKQGNIGALFPSGDAEVLSKKIHDLLSKPREDAALESRSFFEDHLSYNAITSQMIEYYYSILKKA